MSTTHVANECQHCGEQFVYKNSLVKHMAGRCKVVKISEGHHHLTGERKKQKREKKDKSESPFRESCQTGESNPKPSRDVIHETQIECYTTDETDQFLMF